MADRTPIIDADRADRGLTISRAARAVGLSRTTLMYYERLGLIQPRRRPGSRYRTFAVGDLQALVLIARWRSVGLPLQTIRRLLAHRDEAPRVLREHMRALDRTIAALQEQRRATRVLLAGRIGPARELLTKAAWSRLFRAIGIGDAQMRQWHAEFERHSGAAHRAFLRSLGLRETEIGRIRSWCMKGRATARARGGTGAHAPRRPPRAEASSTVRRTST